MRSGRSRAGRPPPRRRGNLKRYAAPVAFLAAVTVAVLLVRDALNSDSVPGTTTVATTRPSGPGTTATIPVRRRRYHRLRFGETLSDVAVRFDTTVEHLLALNPGIEPTNLEVGQRIRVH